jgi:hypothetical protein
MSTEKHTELPHSPLPWYWKPINDGIWAHRIYSEDGVIIADVLWHETNKDVAPLPPMAKANADYIVEAVNNYTRSESSRQELLEALEAAREWLSRFGEHAPIVFGGEHALDDKMRIAIANANQLKASHD